METKVLNDQELVDRYLAGDEKGLAILIERHKRKIFTSIYMLVRDHHLAEDFFQETFIKVVNTLRSGTYNDEGKFLPWVLRIAHNLVIDHFRKDRRMQFSRDTEEYSVFDNIGLEDEGAEDKLLKKQRHKAIRELVNRLPQEQKEVLIMRHFADLSFKEIADITGVSINTALGRMRYALINLRKLITEERVEIAL